MKLDFYKKCGKLYENHEQAKVETFYFENSYGKMANVFMKREIPNTFSQDKLFDIMTPYGFGGPMIIDSKNTEELIKDYQDAFALYCKKENIVSEFIRFHPLDNTDVREQFVGDVEYVGPQVIRDLSQEVNENISKRNLKQYRSNKRKGMKVVFDQTGEWLESFLDIYYSTMKRNEAHDFYYFDRQFFERLHEEMKGHFVYSFIILDDVIISSGLTLIDNLNAYGFLGGTKDNYYDMCPNVNMLIEEIKWLKERGLSYYLLGGGHKGKDGIYQFKKKFAKDSNYDYYVGKIVHDTVIYEELVKERFKITPSHLTTSFFPAYRAKNPQLNNSPT